jgi:hypothetical protein
MTHASYWKVSYVLGPEISPGRNRVAKWDGKTPMVRPYWLLFGRSAKSFKRYFIPE